MAEFHSFVRERQQVDVSGSRSRVLINSAFAFCNQPRFRSGRIIYKLKIRMFRGHLGLLMILHVCCLQVFQLTALLVKSPSELHPVFTVSLIGVAIDHKKVNGAVACVQGFVRQPLFTQRNFFSETGISMINTAVAAADAVRHSSHFYP